MSSYLGDPSNRSPTARARSRSPSSSRPITPQQAGRHLIKRATTQAEAITAEVPCLTCHQQESSTINTAVRLSTLDLVDYVNQKWKNGKGETTQIAICPTSATHEEEFDYRITSAAITHSSAFSRFPGYTRHIVILNQPVSPAHPVVHVDDPDKVDRAPKITLHHDKRKRDRDQSIDDTEWKDESDTKEEKESEEYAIKHLIPYGKHRFQGEWQTHVHLQHSTKLDDVTGFHVSDFNIFTNDKVCFALCDVITLKPGASESFVLQFESAKKHHHYIYVADNHAQIDLLAVDTKQQLHKFWHRAAEVNPFTLVLQHGQTLKLESLRHKHKDGAHPDLGVHVVAPKDCSTAVIIVSIEFIDGQ